MPMLGEHNVQNALAAIAIAAEMEIGESVIRRALASFEGVKRRFTHVGDVGGITIIDDYGHHPVEIAAVLKTARAAVKGKVIAVVQPHRYTRLRDLFEEFCRCFNDADAVIVADVFEAGEEPIEGIHRESLVEGLGHHGHRTVMPLAEPSDLAGIIDGLAGPGDMVVCLGAGDITRWANALPDELRQYRSKGKEAANDAG
jgi:UDP-N-acetylmuramate--alanine ligase